MERALALQQGENALVLRQRSEDGLVRLLLRQERQHFRLRDDDRGAHLPRGGRAARGAGRYCVAQGLAARRRPATSGARRSTTSSSWRRNSSRRRSPRARAPRRAATSPIAGSIRRRRSSSASAMRRRPLRAQGASRQRGDFERGHGRGGALGRRRRHPGALRSLPRPRDVSDHRSARPRDRLRRPRAREGRAGEISEFAGDAALPQGRNALQHRRRARGRAQGRGR